MGKNRIKLTESQIKRLIKESVKESFLGFNGNDFASMGLKNPADEFQINYREIGQKFLQFGKYLQEMREYIDGVEEDTENNIAGTKGVRDTVSMRAMWTDDEEEKAFNESLKQIIQLIWKLETAIKEVADETEYH